MTKVAKIEPNLRLFTMTSCVKRVNAELNASELSIVALVRTPGAREVLPKLALSNSPPAHGKPDHTFGVLYNRLSSKRVPSRKVAMSRILPYGREGATRCTARVTSRRAMAAEAMRLS